MHEVVSNHSVLMLENTIYERVGVLGGMVVFVVEHDRESDLNEEIDYLCEDSYKDEHEEVVNSYPVDIFRMEGLYDNSGDEEAKSVSSVTHVDEDQENVVVNVFESHVVSALFPVFIHLNPVDL